MKRRIKILFIMLSLCSSLLPETLEARQRKGGSATKNIDAKALAGADARPGDWISHGRTYSEARYSPLNRIDSGNVKRLGLAWSFDAETTRGLEATPIVVAGTLYTTGAWSVVYAIDARTGRQLWKWDPQVSRAYGQRACCDVVNRGVAVYKGKIYVGVLDGRLAGLDAETGLPVWQIPTVEQNQPYTITGAPRIVKGKVIIGNGGGEYGVRGYVSAYDAETGKLAWRFYTVPGDPSKAHESPALERARRPGTASGGRWGRVYGVGLARLRPGARPSLCRDGQRLSLESEYPQPRRRR